MTPVRVLLLAVGTLAAAAVALDLSGGSTSESIGVVNSVGRAANPNGSPQEIANVRLESGKLVTAALPDGVKTREGESVRLRVLSRISGATTYQVLGPGDERMDSASHH